MSETARILTPSNFNKLLIGPVPQPPTVPKHTVSSVFGPAISSCLPPADAKPTARVSEPKELSSVERIAHPVHALEQQSLEALL